MSSRSQTFDSSGPEGRVRGNAHQVYEKYLALARDATAAGDRITAEGFYQFAEHYYRMVNDSTDPQSEGSQAPRRFDQRRDPSGEQPDVQPSAPRAAEQGSAPPTTPPSTTPPANGADRTDGAHVDGSRPEGGAAIAVAESEAQPEIKAQPAPKRRAPRRRKPAAGNGAEPEAEAKEASVDDGETEPVTP